MKRLTQTKPGIRRHALVAAVAAALAMGIAGNAAAQGFPATLSVSSLDGASGFRMDGVAASDFTGRSVSEAGDINGDGIGDVVIGAQGADPNGSYSGSSFIVFGRSTGFASAVNLSTLDGSNGFRLNGAAAAERVGWSVGAAGDVNGDGIGDLIVGAYRASPNGNLSGRTYVVFGHTGTFAATIDASSLDGSDGFRLDGVAATDYSGFSVDGAGDVNGDGIDDLIIGASRADPNGAQSGSSYVVFGHTGASAATINLSSLNGANGFRLDGVAASDYVGRSVSSAGDVNGDGIGDVIVGAFGTDPNGSFSGGGYVVFGHTGTFAATLNLSNLDGTTGFRLDGVAVQDYAGRSVSVAGDINGDGFDDVMMGADRADPNGDGSGSTYVVFGHSGAFAAAINLSTLDGMNGFRVDGVTVSDNSASAVSGLDDVNGDGIGDLIIGASRADPSGSESGSSYVVFGHQGAFSPVLNLSSLDGVTGFRIDGAGAFTRSGFAVSGAGDVNGDDLADLIIGAYRASPNGAQSGSGYVVFGRNTILLFKDGFE